MAKVDFTDADHTNSLSRLLSRQLRLLRNQDAIMNTDVSQSIFYKQHVLVHMQLENVHTSWNMD